MPQPLAFFITFTTYGTRLHGDERGSVDRRHTIPGTPTVEPNPARKRYEENQQRAPPYLLDAPARQQVLEAIREVCTHRNWNLLAAHVRTNHVHVVVQSEKPPEQVMRDLKAYASRRLHEKCWTRHGSTQYLWQPEEVASAIQYALEEQGGQMAVYPRPHAAASAGNSE